MRRSLRPRGLIAFDKPPLSIEDLVERVLDRGLHVPDRAKARRYLQHISYYRVSPCMIPFQNDGPDHLSREETSFDDVLDLYAFERALRLLVRAALERIAF